MWWLILVIVVVWATTSIFYRENDEGRIVVPLGLSTIIFIFFFAFTHSTYLSRDIRKGHEVQYREVQYGKVDSIAYYINGELVDYNEINGKK